MPVGWRGWRAWIRALDMPPSPKNSMCKCKSSLRLAHHHPNPPQVRITYSVYPQPRSPLSRTQRGVTLTTRKKLACRRDDATQYWRFNFSESVQVPFRPGSVGGWTVEFKDDSRYCTIPQPVAQDGPITTRRAVGLALRSAVF